MVRIIYLSKASYLFSHDELSVMCREFAAANIRRQVTGALLRIGNYFVQILEGDSAVVRELMEKTLHDSRHGAVNIPLEQDDVQRAFADWSMNLIDCETTYYFNLAELPELREQIATMAGATDDQRQLFSSLILKLVHCVRSSPSSEPVGAA